MMQMRHKRKKPTPLGTCLPVLCIFFLTLAWGCGSNSGNSGSLQSFVDKARQQQDQAKLKVISVAAAQFEMEIGRNPESLDELVEKGFLNAAAIKDHRGQKFAGVPGTPSSDGGVTKSCGSCGKAVASSSKVGDRCPHCRVVWGREQTSYGN